MTAFEFSVLEDEKDRKKEGELKEEKKLRKRKKKKKEEEEKGIGYVVCIVCGASVFTHRV